MNFKYNQCGAKLKFSEVSVQQMETERLIIDSIKESDKEDYFNNISHDRKVLETFICRYAETLDDFDFSSYPMNENMFAIRLKETKKLIGIILYFDENDGICEIGYGIGSGYWNHGYATEAAKRFIDYCFREKGFHTVCASFFTGNNASKRVMEKCGMTYSRFSEKELSYLGVERDLTYYSISRKKEIILLNGPSSAGKSTIARALKTELCRDDPPAVIIALDDYLKMSADEPIWEDDVFETVPKMCGDIADALQSGKTVIIDHVITSKRIFDALTAAASGHGIEKVLIKCSVEILRKREAARGNRCLGSAEASLQYLYPQDGYDLVIDSGETEPAEAARTIAAAVRSGR